MTEGTGTSDDPWRLHTPPGTSGSTMHLDEAGGRGALVCTVGKTTLTYDRRCLDDLRAFLLAPLMEALGLAELQHLPRNNRMLAV